MSPAGRTTTDREATVRGWLPIAIAIAGAVFSAGGAYAAGVTTAAETERVRARLDAHLAADTSAVLAEQVRTARGDVTTLESDLRAMREALERIDRNLAVVCASTPRAQCVR